MGHHNLCDSAATDGVQKGEKTWALPVEPTPCITDELVVRVGSPEIIALAFEVGVLVGAADAGIANATAWLRFVETNLVLEVGEAVESFPFPPLTPDDFNFALFGPVAKSA